MQILINLFEIIVNSLSLAKNPFETEFDEHNHHDQYEKDYINNNKMYLNCRAILCWFSVSESE